MPAATSVCPSDPAMVASTAGVSLVSRSSIGRVLGVTGQWSTGVVPTAGLASPGKGAAHRPAWRSDGIERLYRPRERDERRMRQESGSRPAVLDLLGEQGLHAGQLGLGGFGALAF